MVKINNNIKKQSLFLQETKPKQPQIFKKKFIGSKVKCELKLKEFL